LYDQEASQCLCSNSIPQISQAIIMRKRTFLDGNDWKAITNTITIERDLLHYQLVDIMTGIPGVLEQSDLESSAQILAGEPLQISTSLLQGVVDLITQLFQWRRAWEKANPNFVSEVVVEPGVHFSVDENGSPLFKTIFFYSHTYYGRSPMFYNASLIILFGNLSTWGVDNAAALALEQILPDEQTNPTNPLTLPHEYLSVNEIAIEICRSVEFFLQGKQKMSGVLNLMLPVRTVIDVLPDSCAVRGWLHNVFEKMGVGKGFQFSKRLRRKESLLGDLDISLDEKLKSSNEL
jgi:hypothetical protein